MERRAKTGEDHEVKTKVWGMSWSFNWAGWLYHQYISRIQPPTPSTATPIVYPTTIYCLNYYVLTDHSHITFASILLTDQPGWPFWKLNHSSTDNPSVVSELIPNRSEDNKGLNDIMPCYVQSLGSHHTSPRSQRSNHSTSGLLCLPGLLGYFSLCLDHSAPQSQRCLPHFLHISAWMSTFH